MQFRPQLGLANYSINFERYLPNTEVTKSSFNEAVAPSALQNYKRRKNEHDKHELNIIAIKKALKSQRNLFRTNHKMQSGSKTLHSVVNMHCKITQ